MATILTPDDRKELIKLIFASFAFLVGCILLAMLVWIPVPAINQPMANIALGAVVTTIIGVPIAFVLGGNPTKKPADASIVGDNANITTTDPSDK